MEKKPLKQAQFGLFSLFAVTLATCVLLGAWRWLGLERLIIVLAVSPAVLIAILLALIWLREKIERRRRRFPC